LKPAENDLSNRFFCIRERFTFHQLFERGQNRLLLVILCDIKP